MNCDNECACHKASIELPITGLKISVDAEALKTAPQNSWAEYFIVESQDWVVPETGRYCVWCQGAGGGGGGGSAKLISAGGGGNSGVTLRQVVFLEEGTAIPIGIGKGGAGGVGKAEGNSAGSGGGETFFGEFCKAHGGEGGRGWSNATNTVFSLHYSVTQPTHAQGKVSTLQIGHSAGILDIDNNLKVLAVHGGAGGNSTFGSGGTTRECNKTVGNNGGNGFNATGYGAGGSGYAKLSGTGNGGNGSDGCVLIERIA